MIYFNNCTSIDEVKSLYKNLAKKNHPDVGGVTEIMQAINTEYAFAVAKIARGENLSAEQTNSIIEESEAYREAISKVINIQNIIIEVVGTWIWLTGETKPVKDQIKAAGFFWGKNKMAWYFRTAEHKVRSFTKTTLDENRAKYGSKVINRVSFNHVSN